MRVRSIGKPAKTQTSQTWYCFYVCLHLLAENFPNRKVSSGNTSNQSRWMVCHKRVSTQKKRSIDNAKLILTPKWFHYRMMMNQTELKIVIMISFTRLFLFEIARTGLFLVDVVFETDYLRIWYLSDMGRFQNARVYSILCNACPSTLIYRVLLNWNRWSSNKIFGSYVFCVELS